MASKRQLTTSSARAFVRSPRAAMASMSSLFVMPSSRVDLPPYASLTPQAHECQRLFPKGDIGVDWLSTSCPSYWADRFEGDGIQEEGTPLPDGDLEKGVSRQGRLYLEKGSA